MFAVFAVFGKARIYCRTIHQCDYAQRSLEIRASKQPIDRCLIGLSIWRKRIWGGRPNCQQKQALLSQHNSFGGARGLIRPNRFNIWPILGECVFMSNWLNCRWIGVFFLLSKFLGEWIWCEIKITICGLWETTVRLVNRFMNAV